MYYYGKEICDPTQVFQYENCLEFLPYQIPFGMAFQSLEKRKKDEKEQKPQLVTNPNTSVEQLIK